MLALEHMFWWVVPFGLLFFSHCDASTTLLDDLDSSLLSCLAHVLALEFLWLSEQ